MLLSEIWDTQCTWGGDKLLHKVKQSAILLAIPGILKFTNILQAKITFV